MARARIRNYVSSLDSTWSIQDEKMVIIKKTAYLESEAVDINVLTGLIGVPQQTDEGINVKCLLNNRIKIGGRIRLNNAEVLQLLQQNPDAAPIPYSQWAGIQNLAALNGAETGDGLYRAFVVDHEGDSRGNPWFTNLICLAVNESAPAEKSVKGI